MIISSVLGWILTLWFFYVIQGDKEWCKFDGESIFCSEVFLFCILVRVYLPFGLTKGPHNKELLKNLTTWFYLWGTTVTSIFIVLQITWQTNYP